MFINIILIIEMCRFEYDPGFLIPIYSKVMNGFVKKHAKFHSEIDIISDIDLISRYIS